MTVQEWWDRITLAMLAASTALLGAAGVIAVRRVRR